MQLIWSLYAVEVDIGKRKQKYKVELSEKLRRFMKWADIRIKSDNSWI